MSALKKLVHRTASDTEVESGLDSGGSEAELLAIAEPDASILQID